MSDLKSHRTYDSEFKLNTVKRNKEQIAENLLNPKFIRDIPNKAWVSNLTYLRVKLHWIYLVMFIDLFNRKVVGWDLSSSLETRSTVQAFRMAIWPRKLTKGLLVHSGGGVQYASKDFRKELHLNNGVQSMSRAKEIVGIMQFQKYLFRTINATCLNEC